MALSHLSYSLVAIKDMTMLVDTSVNERGLRTFFKDKIIWCLLNTLVNECGLKPNGFRLRLIIAFALTIHIEVSVKALRLDNLLF